MIFGKIIMHSGITNPRDIKSRIVSGLTGDRITIAINLIQLISGACLQ